MSKQTIHMRVVRDVLARQGLEIIDMNLLTTGVSSYGVYLEEEQSVTVMNAEHKMNTVGFDEILANLKFEEEQQFD